MFRFHVEVFGLSSTIISVLVYSERWSSTYFHCVVLAVSPKQLANKNINSLQFVFTTSAGASLVFDKSMTYDMLYSII